MALRPLLRWPPKSWMLTRVSACHHFLSSIDIAILVLNSVLVLCEKMLLPFSVPLDNPLPISITNIFLAAGSVTVLFRYFIQPVFLSPLSKYPAPHWSCHFSPLWSWWAKCYGWENRLILATHQEKGDIIRTAPNSIHINSAEGLKTIYMGDFPRAKFYWAAFKNYEYVRARPSPLNPRLLPISR